MGRTARIALSLTLAAAAALSAIGCSNPYMEQRAEREARARELLREAEAMAQSGLDDAALAAFGLALEENPRLTEAHLGIGNLYRRRGDYDRASNAYERAVAIDPASFDAQYNLGLVRQLMGQIDLAIPTYLRALMLQPDSFPANRDLASAYLQIGRAREAIPYARRATELDRSSQPAWCNLAAAFSLAGRYNEAIAAYRQAAELGELATPVMLGMADAHIQLGNHYRAISVLELVLRRDEPDSAIAHERMGLALFKLRRYDEALEQYHAALAIDKRSTAALNGVGVCLMTRYLLDREQDEAVQRRAVEAWRESLRLRPDQPHIVDLLARFGR